MDLCLVPVVRVALKHDAVLRNALGETKRPRTHRLAAKIGRIFPGRLRRNHHAGAIGQHRQQRRERRRQVQAGGQVIQHIDAGNRRQFAAAVRAGQVLVALDIEFDRRGIEFLAVVEGHALAQLQGQGLVVRRPGIGSRQLRHDVELVVDIEQLVAQRGEHDAADEAACHGRIEDIGVFGQADAQGLCLRAGHKQAGRDGEDGAQPPAEAVKR